MKTLMLLVQSFALFLCQSSSVSGGTVKKTTIIITLCYNYFEHLIGPIQKCTEKFMDLSLVTFRAQNIGKHPAPGWGMDNQVRVIQEYQFNCSSTNISSIILGIKIKENSSSRKAFPSILVYGPRGNGSQYDLVEGSERYIYYSTSNVSTSGVFEYPLNPPIPVLGGDLLAVSQPPAKQSVFTILLSKGGNFFNSCKLPRGKKTVKLCSASVTNQIVLAYPKTSGLNHCIVILILRLLLIDENCVNSSNSVKMLFIVKRALRVIKSISLGYEKQYLYPEMAFSCNGTITKWIYGAKVTNPISHVTMLPELQIWRKIGYSNYMKIGSSTVNGNKKIGTKLYMFIPQPPLQFQEGDIFGIYVPNKQNTTLRLYTQEQNGPLNLVLHSHYPLVKVNGMDSLVTSTMKNFPLVTAVISE